MDNIEFIGNSCLKNNKCIEMLYHPKLEEVGDMYMTENEVLYYIFVPNLFNQAFLFDALLLG